MKTPYARGASADWQPWFAWYPLTINGQSVWLQTVLRRPESLRIAHFHRRKK
jgi:hypothetical protein